MQPFDMEIGAGTYHPITFLKALESKPIFAAYVQPSRRPIDGRYGKNQNRLQHYYQFQVIMKPSPNNIQNLYLNSLKNIGIDFNIHDIRFVEDNWENPTLASWGLGWEVWINGMEITQFTYFQQVGGLTCNPIMGEITYGIERLSMYLQNVSSVYDLVWSKNPSGITTYRDLFYKNEIEQSKYNFEYADINFLIFCFEQYEKEINILLKLKKPIYLPAYELIIKTSHIFNLLESRKAISVTERKNFIKRISTLTKVLAKNYCISH